MSRLRHALAIVSVLALVACGSGDPPDRASADSSPKGDHVWKSMTDQMDKAKAVEGQLNEASQDRMKEVNRY